MKIVVAPDSFKGTLSACEAASIMAEGVHRVRSDIEVVLCPLADGGEGTAEILAPYLRKDEVVIESAKFIGLTLPEMQKIPVEKRSSDSLGIAIKNTLNQGFRKIVIALGGTGTHDGGIGLLSALGVCFRDQLEAEVPLDMSGMRRVTEIDISDLDPRLADCELVVLSDVNSPLCGDQGSTVMFGPQKGVANDDVNGIDHDLHQYANLCEHVFVQQIQMKSGVGAAGGLGFALKLLGGKLISGSSYVLDKTGFSELIYDADWVVTGEGQSDAQTLAGKLPFMVAKMARINDVPIVLISGDIDGSSADVLGNYFDQVITARCDAMSLSEAMEDAGLLLADAAESWAKSVV
ncbi:MAG: glycerate kinase [Mariprofundaceae bacterium]